MKINISVLLFFVLVVLPSTAQSTSLTSGGDFLGESGSMSISVGEPFCAISSNNEERLNFFQLGVQQTLSLILLSVKSNNLGKFEVYPNPTQAYLHVSISDIQTETELIPYVVYSSDGKRFLVGTLINNDINAIDVQQLSSGQYILKLDTPQNQNAHFIKCD